jgi:hypothetical protein
MAYHTTNQPANLEFSKNLDRMYAIMKLCVDFDAAAPPGKLGDAAKAGRSPILQVAFTHAGEHLRVLFYFVCVLSLSPYPIRPGRLSQMMLWAFL